MTLLDLLRKESTVPLRPLLLHTGVSGLANALLLFLINASTEATIAGRSNSQYLLLFVVAMVLFVVTKRAILERSSVIIEAALKQVRLRIVNKIRYSNLLTIEQKGDSVIYNRLTQEVGTVSKSSQMIINGLQSAVLFVFSMLYVLTISVLAFVIILVGVLIAAYVYERKRQQIVTTLQESSREDIRFYEALNHVLKGFKESKLNHRRSASIFAALRRIADECMNLRIRASRNEAVNFVFSQIFFYTLIGVIVFVLPVFGLSGNEADPAAGNGAIVKISSSVLFIMGPISAMIGIIPMLSIVNLSVGNIYRLEDEISASMEPEAQQRYADYALSGDESVPVMAFDQEIRLSNIRFHYDNASGDTFQLGPLSELVVRRGEILFIEGGNGSGKSTLMKVLTGLYLRTDEGQIAVDGVPVTDHNYQGYRELFATVFTDFHLTTRLYGQSVVDERRIHQLLQQLGMTGKTGLNGDAFTSINLSTGQRKRLALLVALLEDKPVLVLDELAADQDPEFKKYFYTTLLPELKAQGRTIIAVTHDDRYFEFCDRKIKMENGLLVSETSSGAH